MMMVQQQGRPWDDLASLAVVNIFSKSSIKDRIYNLPFVCKSWAHSSLHPRCWTSFTAAAAIDAFVKSSGANFVDPFDGRRSTDPRHGLLSLQTLIGRAAGGSALTSLYFFPFLTSPHGPPNDDALLSLIARCCPNLKHISFHGSFNASEEVVLEFVRRCRCLELVDFSDSPYFTPSVLEEMSVHCPNVRGIRRNGIVQLHFSSILIRCFPYLKLLNLSDSTIVDSDLCTLLAPSSGLEYLDIMRCPKLMLYMYMIKRVYGQIAQLHFD